MVFLYFLQFISFFIYYNKLLVLVRQNPSPAITQSLLEFLFLYFCQLCICIYLASFEYRRYLYTRFRRLQILMAYNFFLIFSMIVDILNLIANHDLPQET